MNFLKKLFSRSPRIQKVDITRRFDLIGRVGQGSMSKVWRARDSMTGRTCALKVLDLEKTIRLEARFPGLIKPTEGEVAVELKHPNIVETYEHGITTENEQFLVMEFVEGVGLSYLVDVQNETMQRHRLQFMIQLGRAVAYFHRQNWIHRDICPRNVLVDRENNIKLIDFGLVVPNTADFRAPGNRTGTAHYMAPELIKRRSTDQRIDIYSYALTCYEMVTGRLPWEYLGETIDVVVQHMNTPPKDIFEFAPKTDKQIAAAIMKGMEPEPDDRWNTVTEMIAELQAADDRLKAARKSRSGKKRA